VKPSALAGKLENSFRVLICRDLTSWFEDLQCGKHSNCRFEEVQVFFNLARVENSDILLEAGRVLIFLAVYCRLWVSLASYFCGDWLERHHFRSELRKPFFLGAWGVLGSLLGAGRVVLLSCSVLSLVGGYVHCVSLLRAWFSAGKFGGFRPLATCIHCWPFPLHIHELRVV